MSGSNPTPTMTTSMGCGCNRRFRRTRWSWTLQFRSLLFGLLLVTIGVWEWDSPVVILLLRPAPSIANSSANSNSNVNSNRVQSLVVAFSPWRETLSRSRSRSRWTTKTKRNTNAAVALLNHSLLPRTLTGSSGESARAFPTALCSQSSSNSNDSDNEKDETNDKDNDEIFRRRNQQWVVLVDDEESIRYAVGDFLYDRGYEVTACADANSLLDLIALRNNNNNNNNPSSFSDNSNDDQQPRLPDVIISDVRMPESDKNGYELVEFLRSGAALSPSSSSSSPSSSPPSSLSLPPSRLATERSKRYGASLRTVPIVLLTAKAMTDDRIKGYRAGADVVVPKPFSPEELVSILDNLIRLRQQRLRPDAVHTSSSSSSSSIVQQHDLRKLKAELEEIRSIVEHNAATTVRKTDVVLTDKERTAVRLLSEGCTPREMARELLGGGSAGGGAEASTATSTIHEIVKELCERTGTESKTELVRWARAVGYI